MRRAFTISELLVILLVLAVLLAALAPVTARLRSSSGQMASAANLHLLAFAHALYALDWDDRQFTMIADDFSLGGTPAGYLNSAGCLPPALLGYGEDFGLWGYFLPCHQGGFGALGNIQAHLPMNFESTTAFGAHRLGNIRAFNTYVTGRFYSPVFYAPNDTITHSLASVAFDNVSEFHLGPDGPTNPNTGQAVIVFSSYALSPAAMWNPAVLSENAKTGLWWTEPMELPLGHQSPTVSQCLHPDLKTRIIEHNWNLGQPGPVNPAFAGGITPYFYSHGIDAAPLTLFFDGHVAELPNAQVAADDAKVLAATRGAVGLWSRDTPFGSDGYYGAQSFDDFVTGHHALTADGIQGRDVLSAGAPRDGGVASASAGERRRFDRRRHRAEVRAPLADPPGRGLMASVIESE